MVKEPLVRCHTSQSPSSLLLTHTPHICLHFQAESAREKDEVYTGSPPSTKRLPTTLANGSRNLPSQDTHLGLERMSVNQWGLEGRGEPLSTPLRNNLRGRTQLPATGYRTSKIRPQPRACSSQPSPVPHMPPPGNTRTNSRKG